MVRPKANADRSRVNFWRRNMAIDLGTTSTLIFLPGKGIVLQEPSVIALSGGKVLEAGEQAHRMLWRTPEGIEAIKPIKRGVISDYHLTRLMLECFIKRVLRRHLLLRLRVIISVPYGTTQVERRAVLAAGKRSGVKEIYLIEEPIAAAIGSGLAVEEPRGRLIVNCGGGITEIAVISLGGIVVARSIRQGGEWLDETIQRYLFRRYRMEVGPATAEEAKISIGYATDPPADLSYTFRGIDLQRSAPGSIKVTAAEITEAITPELEAVATAVREVFEEIPADLASDIMEDGICLVGGGALLRNIDIFLNQLIGLPVRIVDEPLTCVVRGAAAALKYIDRLELTGV